MSAQHIVRYLLLTCCALPASLVHAALTNCPDLNAFPGEYKVVLDELTFATTANGAADLAALKSLLQFNFNSQINGLRSAAARLPQNRGLRLRLVLCSGRSPSFNGGEFTATLAERLSDERVVVEMWGALDLQPAVGQTPIAQARIGYVIPPLQHYEKGADAPPALHVIAYPKATDGRAVTAVDALPELRAFALVGLGTKAARAKTYDLAVWAFTLAQSSIADAQLGEPNTELAALLAYVRQASCIVRANARADSNYRGPLRLLAAQRCEAGR